MREAWRFDQLSRRRARCPAISSGGIAELGPWASRHRAGMSAGSFWPSPSRVAIHRPRAALTPLRIAALWPQLFGVTHEAKLRQARLQPADLGAGRIVAAVVDIDDLVPDAALESDGERGGDLGDQRGNVAGLVLDRNDDRKIHARNAAPPGLYSAAICRCGSASAAVMPR